jgi:hypothetical protein
MTMTEQAIDAISLVPRERVCGHVSEGFKAVQFEYGSNFFCARCEVPVEP